MYVAEREGGIHTVGRTKVGSGLCRIAALCAMESVEGRRFETTKMVGGLGTRTRMARNRFLSYPVLSGGRCCDEEEEEEEEEAPGSQDD